MQLPGWSQSKAAFIRCDIMDVGCINHPRIVLVIEMLVTVTGSRTPMSGRLSDDSPEIIPFHIRWFTQAVGRALESSPYVPCPRKGTVAPDIGFLKIKGFILLRSKLRVSDAAGKLHEEVWVQRLRQILAGECSTPECRNPLLWACIIRGCKGRYVEVPNKMLMIQSNYGVSDRGLR
jgi:hypothetical protein